MLLDRAPAALTMTLLMSAAAKSRQLISGQRRVGSLPTLHASRRCCRDCLDLHLEFGARETLNDRGVKAGGGLPTNSSRTVMYPPKYSADET